MQTWAMVVLGLIVAWQLWALYNLRSSSASTLSYVFWAGWTGLFLGILYLVGGFA